MKSLAVLDQYLQSVELDACTDEVLKGLVRDLNWGQRRLQGYLAQIAGIARKRENDGDGTPTSDLMRSGGEISKREADRLAKRADVSETLPGVGNDE